MRDLGRPLRNRACEREWAEGDSVYDTVERARDVARQYALHPGRYIVMLMVPTDSMVEFKQTFDMEHFDQEREAVDQLIRRILQELSRQEVVAASRNSSVS